jgi:hypothetical protein
METVKHGHESRGTQTRERLCWRGLAATVNYKLDLSSETAHHKQTRNCLNTILRIRRKIGRRSQIDTRNQEKDTVGSHNLAMTSEGNLGRWEP